MAFCFTFILDEDLSAPSDRDGETFISLDERDAVSGPYKDSTPATLRRVQIVSSSPHRMPAGYFSREADPGLALTYSCKYQDISLFPTFSIRFRYVSITLKISRHLR